MASYLYFLIVCWLQLQRKLSLQCLRKVSQGNSIMWSMELLWRVSQVSHKNEKDKDRLENENSDMSFDKRQCLNLTRRTKTGGERKVVVQDSDGCAQHHSPGDSHSSEGSSGWNDWFSMFSNMQLTHRREWRASCLTRLRLCWTQLVRSLSPWRLLAP